jgi:hypothetical protein
MDTYVDATSSDLLETSRHFDAIHLTHVARASLDHLSTIVDEKMKQEGAVT